MCWEVAFLLYNMTGPPVLCKICDYCVLYQVMEQLFHLPLHSVIAYLIIVSSGVIVLLIKYGGIKIAKYNL